MTRIRQAALGFALLILAASGLYGCEGDTPPTATPIIPTATPVPPTATLAPTSTPVPPSTTPLPPTSTPTVTPSPTSTPVPPTSTPLPPTATATHRPATATRVPTRTAAPKAVKAAPTATATKQVRKAAPSPTKQGASGASGSAAANDPAAIALMDKSAQAMKGLKSVHIVVDIVGGSFPGTAVGDSVFPDRSRITLGSPAGDTEEIMIGSQAYIKLPISSGYLPVPADSAPVNVNQTLNSLDAYVKNAQGATIVGNEKVQGVDTVHVRFRYDPNKVQSIAPGLLGGTTAAQLSTGDMWIEKGTGYLRVFKTDVPFTDSEGNPQPGTVAVTLSKFNETVTPPIERPGNTP